MAGRRVQYQGYRFVLRRQAGALLRPEQDSADSPLRRLSLGAAGSVALAGLAMVAAVLVGVFSPAPGRSGWENSKTLIVDAETGTRYVYLDGALHPVLNYASALLILKSGAVTAVQVPDAQLSAVPHGPPVGIPGAPDEVPGSTRLTAATWSACSAPAQTPAGDPWSLVQVGLGAAPGGTVLGRTAAALVVDPSGDEFVVWNGTRLAVPGGAAYVPAVLGASSTPPITVGDAWLDTVRQGPNLTAPDVRGPVVQVTTTGAYYARTSEGLAPLTSLQAQLLMAEEQQNAPIGISAAQAADAPESGVDPAAETGLPAAVPTLAASPQGGLSICAQFTGGQDAVVTITTQARDARQLAASPVVPVDGLGAPVADAVSLPPGRGALIQAVPEPGVTTGTEYLVTDLGVKYPVTGDSVLGDLGLSGATATRIPESLAAIIPTGPALSETAALVTQPAAAGAPASADATTASGR